MTTRGGHLLRALRSGLRPHTRSRGYAADSIGRYALTLTALAFAAWLVGGCAADPLDGWSVTTTYPEGVSSVAVGVFENSTFERDFEYDLTDALVKEIEARTPYKVTSTGRADTILTGTIHKIQRRQLSKSTLTGLSEEVTVGMTIDLVWRDLRTNESLLELESFTAHSLFVPSNPTREPIEIARFGVAQSMARDIVDQMRADW